MNTGDLVIVKVPGNIFYRCCISHMVGPDIFSCYVTGDSADGITFRNVMWSYNRFNKGMVISS